MPLNAGENKKGSEFHLPAFLSASLIFQIIQIGIYPILLSQIMSKNAYEGFYIGALLSVSWLSVFAIGPFVPRIIGRLGHSTVLLLSCAVTVAGLLMLLVFSHLAALAVSAVLVGGGLILRWVSCDTVLVVVSDPGSTGKLIGYHEALMGLGIALGPLLFIFLDLQSVIWACLFLLGCGQFGFLLNRLPKAEDHLTDRRPATW